MELKVALLCDAATVREGLLHLLGGGITRLWRAELPGPFGVQLALMIDVPPEVAMLPHEIQVHLRRDLDQVEVANVMGGFQLGPQARLEEGEHQLVPVVLGLQMVAIEQYGAHTIEISIDNGQTETLRCWVLHPEEQHLPPLGA